MPVLLLVSLALTLPIAVLALAWIPGGAGHFATLAHLSQTVLPDYVASSLILGVCVGLGVAVVGSITAAAVTLFDFPGRRLFEWLLLLPMAMPAYVLAYAYTDALQYSGPLQTMLRGLLGVEGALWPDVRSLGGAIPLFIACLYPYVYLLARGALAERGVHLMEAARLLGAGLGRRVFRVALPMARPAIAAGTALALMETLADYGVGAYFGLSTFTTGIFHAWLSMGDRQAAAQLATLLLVFVGVLLGAEHAAQHRLRFASSRGSGSAQSREARPVRLRGGAAVLAWAVCALPVALGFVLPVLALLRLMLQGELADENQTAWLSRFGQWCLNSFRLAGTAALLATLLALALASARRSGRSRGLEFLARIVGLGYAMPGAVVAMGILLAAGALQGLWPQSQVSAGLTATVAGLIYAYLVRFTAVSQQAIDTGYARIPRSYDESARLLGLGTGALWRRVHAPLLRRATWTAALLVFVDVMKELPATLVLRPFDSDTLAVVASQMARDERLAEAAWPSLAIVAVGLVPVLILSRASRAPR